MERFTFQLQGYLSKTTGWHKCIASPSGRLFFQGGVCHVELDEDAVEAMFEAGGLPYAIDPDAQQARPAGRYAELLSTPSDKAIGDIPPSGPGITFADATSGPRPIISPADLQRAIRKGQVQSFTENGTKKYSLEQIRALPAEDAEKPPKKNKA